MPDSHPVTPHRPRNPDAVARQKMRDFTHVPVIDLGPALGPGTSAASRQAVADEIGRACERVGFFYVANHGISRDRIDAAWDAGRRFFALPLERKREIHISKLPNHRGYLGIGEESLDPYAADSKEVFKIGLELPADDPDFLNGIIMYGPNTWPRDLPGFRDAVYAYYQDMFGLSRELFRLFALAIGIDEHFFDDKIDKPMAQLNLIRYPAHEGEPHVGIGAHSDYECLTLLAQDDSGGLEARNAAGEWIAVPPIDGTFVVNIGDMMARWTNDRFASTVHRVYNRSGRERYSMPFFCGCNYHTVVSCLPNCSNDRDPPHYPDTIAGEHLVGRLDATNAHRRQPSSPATGLGTER